MEYEEDDYAADSKPDYQEDMGGVQKADYSKEADLLGGAGDLGDIL